MGAVPSRSTKSLGLIVESVHIRRYEHGEEAALFDVYYTAIHLVASRNYTIEQVEAWAPQDIDPDLWRDKIRAINPFVAKLNGELVGYADVQSSGYIDHFFVSGRHPRKGIGSLLMQRIFGEAQVLGVSTLTSDVSRTAQPFFEKFGFVLVEQRSRELRGVVVPNALMRR
jgi:putative acetyltransferase